MTLNVILVGGSGYIGSKLADILIERGFEVLSLVRNSHCHKVNENITVKEVSDFCDISDWSEHLKGASCVIYLAGRAHMLKESQDDFVNEFMKINCDTPLRVAASASILGIKRFIYISSIGVLGALNTNENIFNNDSEYDPKDMYSVSKMKAEIGLKKISQSTEMKVIIVRPPLVYGANAPGNFHRLLRLVDFGLPLPLGGINAKKSMISLNNLCDLMVKTITIPLPKLSVFVVTDGSNWSTVELVVLIAKYMGHKSPLFSITAPILMILASLVGKRKEILKLKTSLQVDGSKTAKILNWSPVQLPENGVEEAVKHYLIHKQKSRQKN